MCLPFVPSHSEDAVQVQVGVVDLELAFDVGQECVDEDEVCVCST